jgi:hypothetical protein
MAVKRLEQDAAARRGGFGAAAPAPLPSAPPRRSGVNPSAAP